MNHSEDAPRYIGRCTEADASAHIKKNPVLLLPVCSLKPYGNAAACDCGMVIAEHIAAHLSRHHDILMAPSFNYGYAIAFSAFSGCAGIKKDHLETALLDMITCWRTQGIGLFIVITNEPYTHEAMEGVRTRCAGHAHPTILHTLCWHTDPEISTFLHTSLSDIPGQRNALPFYDQADIAMISHIDPSRYFLSPHHKKTGETHKRPANAPDYTRWKKRGMDPHKYRKNWPNGMLTSAIPVSESFGTHIYHYILDVFTRKTTHLLDGLHA